MFAVVRPFSKSLQQAASPAVFSAVAPEMGTASGIYVNNCFPCQPSDVALNESLRKSLWNASSQILLEKLHARGIKSLFDI
jgi:WW domain-containing oxidoreductase